MGLGLTKNFKTPISGQNICIGNTLVGRRGLQ